MKYLTLSIPGFGNVDSPPVPTGGLSTGRNVMQVLIETTLIVAVLLAIWYVIKGGFDIITSQGDKEKIKIARGRVIYAVLGLIFLFLSFFIVNIFGTLLGIDLLCIVFKTSC